MNFESNNRGSILIWVIALGMALTSIFFFFGSRLRSQALIQRQVVEEQNAREYLESYANYIESLSAEELETLDSFKLDDVTGDLKREEGSISGFLEANQSVTLSVTGNVVVEWNKCEFGQSQELVINGGIKREPADCAGSVEYGNAETVDTTGELVLNAIGPAHYQVTGVDARGTRWRLLLKTPLQYGEDFEIERVFTK